VPCSASHVPRPICHDVLDAETCVTARAGVALAGHKMEDGTVDSSQARIATATSKTWSFAEKSSHHTALMGAK
jgi:hypothetical protein